MFSLPGGGGSHSRQSRQYPHQYVLRDSVESAEWPTVCRPLAHSVTGKTTGFALVTSVEFSATLMQGSPDITGAGYEYGFT